VFELLGAAVSIAAYKIWENMKNPFLINL
jgi:hypothetical protein